MKKIILKSSFLMLGLFVFFNTMDCMKNQFKISNDQSIEKGQEFFGAQCNYIAGINQKDINFLKQFIFGYDNKNGIVTFKNPNNPYKEYLIECKNENIYAVFGLTVEYAESNLNILQRLKNEIEKDNQGISEEGAILKDPYNFNAKQNQFSNNNNNNNLQIIFSQPVNSGGFCC